ncbi:glycosyltransferase [Haloferula sp.]|uniref:glycosyltransferase n=1 Tax=Haloferula sp. TaxID=2497595 RepID=UPI0032A09991
MSVVLPFRDAADTLVAAVQSVLAQDHTDLELILVDDGSVDGSADRLAGVEDPRMSFYRNEHQAGVVGASATGFAKAKGRWIARMDADDLAMPGRIGKQLAAAASNTGVVSGGVELISSCGDGMKRYVEWVNTLTTFEAISRSRFIECPVINPTAMIRRDWFERVGGYHESPWAEDHDLWLRLLEQGCPFVPVPETLLQWRDSPDRLTRCDPRYGDRARSRMRAHYLARLPGLKTAGVVIAGAGPIGKRLARDLQHEEVEVKGFFEVHQRRIGQNIHGAEVASAEESNRWRSSVLLGAVGLEGGRRQVKALALSSGRQEGEDYWAVC